MKRESFNQVVQRTLRQTEEVLVIKNKEYADGDEVFRNFKIAARMKGISPLQALDGMLLKHLVSFNDMVEGRLPLSQALIDEKIGDIINYMILAKGLMEEELETQLKLL